MWNPLCGTTYDTNLISVVFTDCLSSEVGGFNPQNCCTQIHPHPQNIHVIECLRSTTPMEIITGYINYTMINIYNI